MCPKAASVAKHRGARTLILQYPSSASERALNAKGILQPNLAVKIGPRSQEQRFLCLMLVLHLATAHNLPELLHNLFLAT